MYQVTKLAMSALGMLLGCSLGFAQNAPTAKQATPALRQTHRPDPSAKPSSALTPAPSGDFFSNLDGSPMLLTLHHDTEVGTNKPIDIYDFVIEMQIMNSDGNLEPVGLQIHNFYTAKPLDGPNDVNPRGALDCKKWYYILTHEQRTHRPPINKTWWPYVEFSVAKGARVLQTNEHGNVWWSDDLQCWGAQDRFPPF